MPKIRNESRYGDLDVPLLRRVVKAGEEVDVTAEQAALLLAQADVWKPVSSHHAAAKSHDDETKSADEKGDQS